MYITKSTNLSTCFANGECVFWHLFWIEYLVNKKWDSDSVVIQTLSEYPSSGPNESKGGGGKSSISWAASMFQGLYICQLSRIDPITAAQHQEGLINPPGFASLPGRKKSQWQWNSSTKNVKAVWRNDKLVTWCKLQTLVALASSSSDFTLQFHKLTLYSELSPTGANKKQSRPSDAHCLVGTEKHNNTYFSGLLWDLIKCGTMCESTL